MALITVNGTLKDPSGNPTAGSVTFQLANYGASIPRVLGTNSIVTTFVSFVASTAGTWSGSIQGNDTIDPGGTNNPPTTFYEVSFKDVAGNTVATLPFQFTGAGPANLDTQAPLNPVPSPFTIPNNAALLAANQTFTGSNTFTGANSFKAGNIDNILYVDGNLYSTIQAAHDALPAGGGMVIVPAGTYSTSGTTLAITKSNVIIQGCGLDNTIIRSSSASLPTITVGSSLTAVQIRDCTIDHSPAASLNSGAHGISFPATVSACTVERVRVQFNDIGVLLGPADIAWLRQSIIQKNVNDGVRITYTSGAPMQWQLDQLLSQENGGHGYNVLAVGTGGISLGNWHAVSTFGNSGHGISLSGLAANAINGFRLSDGFLGGDGADEIFMDTFGGEHIITGIFVEQAGTGTTGPTLSTAATHTGHGLSFTVNNTDITVIGGYSQGNSYSGLASSATHLITCNFDAMENGQAGTVGAAFQSGIVILSATSASINGGKLTNRTSTTQKYGLYTQADAVTMTGTRVDGNATSPIGSSLTLIQSRFLTGNTSDIMANSNIALSAGWGSTATVTSTQGSKERFFFTVNSSGTGIAANPAITITWPTAWPSFPVFVCKETTTTDALNVQPLIGEQTATTSSMTITWLGTPTTGKNYTFVCSGQ